VILILKTVLVSFAIGTLCGCIVGLFFYWLVYWMDRRD